ncbi:MAG: hypothetical protein HQL77_11750 [Magnetococcales bacterium]|nr:hypothetical protein [Magnetococcales bacterium]MBF0414315.1 hypothetical protein [Magnetococcales bacterium]MBF0418592.1 hypothetical protein [Magnetococcales bacterium]MBF0436032.1 hypothetical protein [Magnetococcales bacterium]
MKSKIKKPLVMRTSPQEQVAAKIAMDATFDEAKRPMRSEKPMLASRDLWDPWDKRNLPGKLG